MTHVPIPGLNPMWMWAICVECLVDRSVGSTIHHQWVQPEDSIFIEGIYVHVFNLHDAYEQGYTGWFRVHRGTLTALESIERPDELRDATEYDCSDYRWKPEDD